MAVTVTVYPITPNFAAEVGDIDLSRKIEPVTGRRRPDRNAEPSAPTRSLAGAGASGGAL